MKQICSCALRKFMSKQLKAARTTRGMSQDKFSEALKMDPRSYADLEHGDNLCCTQTFILFLATFCQDKDALIEELYKIIVQTYDGEETA